MKQQTSNPVPNFFLASAADFKKIPGSPIAYWVSQNIIKTFERKETFVAGIVKSEGKNVTTDNAKFIRFFWEINNSKIGAFDKKWLPCAMGGDFRKWYGNIIHVIDWSVSARYFYRKAPAGRIIREEFWRLPGVTWAKIGSAIPSFRFLHSQEMYQETAVLQNTEFDACFLLGVLNSKISCYYLNFISPTINFQLEDIGSIPILSMDYLKILTKEIVSEARKFAKTDWDSNENSRGFGIFPLIQFNYFQSTLKATYNRLRTQWHEMTLEMQRLEEENNRIFIDAYGLQDELTPEVPLSEITLTCNPHYRYNGSKTEAELEALLLTDTMEELISYAIGCMMGRYRMDRPGLIYAHSGNKDFEKTYHRKDAEDAKKEENSASCQEKNADFREAENPPLRLCGEFLPDDDGIIPVMDMPWFSDDAANRFVEFMKAAWSPETLNENIQFVADTLNPKRSEDPIDTIRRYLSTGFFKDHLKTYKKRPIYWLFSSGKQKAFECLVYLHRYNESTLSRMRSLYVTPLQGNIRSRIEFLDNEQIAATSASDQRKFQKEIEMLKKKQTELVKFDDQLRHYADMRISLDLDDGVKVNYGKFGNLLAEVKAITGE